jgi:hypothetical protein
VGKGVQGWDEGSNMSSQAFGDSFAVRPKAKKQKNLIGTEQPIDILTSVGIDLVKTSGLVRDGFRIGIKKLLWDFPRFLVLIWNTAKKDICGPYHSLNNLAYLLKIQGRN